MQRFVGGLVVAPLDGERRGVYADLNRRRPVGVHLTVFVVVALELQLEVRSAGQNGGKESEVGQVSCFNSAARTAVIISAQILKLWLDMTVITFIYTAPFVKQTI